MIFINIVASRGVAFWHSSKPNPSEACAIAYLSRPLKRASLTHGCHHRKIAVPTSVHGIVDLATSIHVGVEIGMVRSYFASYCGRAMWSSLDPRSVITRPSKNLPVRFADLMLVSGKLLWTWEPLQLGARSTPPHRRWQCMVRNRGRSKAWRWSTCRQAVRVSDFYGAVPSRRQPGCRFSRCPGSSDRTNMSGGFRRCTTTSGIMTLPPNLCLFEFRSIVYQHRIHNQDGHGFCAEPSHRSSALSGHTSGLCRNLDMAGEKTSPTQPFSSLPDLLPRLLSRRIKRLATMRKIRKFCHDKVASLV